MSRINSGTILTAFFAILFGLAGVYLLRGALKPKPTVQVPVQQIKRETRVTVPMASRKLTAGTLVSLDDVALVKMSRADMRKKGLTHAFMTSPNQIIGKTLRVELKRGSTFDTKNFYAFGKGPGIASRLQAGQRAVTIDISATHALLGFAGAGQTVDVLFHYGQSRDYEGRYHDNRDQRRNQGQTWQPPHHNFNAPVASRDYAGNSTGSYGARNGSSNRAGGLGGRFQNATVTLVQGAEILALGRHAVATQESSSLKSDERVHVTLAVGPEDAELLRVADGHGELSLTLRSPNDQERVELNGPKTLAQIVPIAVAIPQKPQRMVIYRGNRRSQLQFDPSGGRQFGPWDPNQYGGGSATKQQTTPAQPSQSDLSQGDGSQGNRTHGNKTHGSSPPNAPFQTNTDSARTSPVPNQQHTDGVVREARFPEYFDPRQ